MSSRRRWPHTILAPLAVVSLCTAALFANDQKPAKANLVVSANPSIGFAPTRVVFKAELKGGADNEMYCPSIEWDWGDDTKTATSEDCDPFEAGKSEIKRRWVIDRVFNMAGDWRVHFRLKHKDKVVAQGSTVVKVRPGVRDGGDGAIR